MFINPPKPPETPCFSWFRWVEEERSKGFSELSGQFRGSCLSAFHRDSWVFVRFMDFRGFQRRFSDFPEDQKEFLWVWFRSVPRVFQGISECATQGNTEWFQGVRWRSKGFQGSSKGTQCFLRDFMGVPWGFRGFQHHGTPMKPLEHSRDP